MTQEEMWYGKIKASYINVDKKAGYINVCVCVVRVFVCECMCVCVHAHIGRWTKADGLSTQMSVIRIFVR